MMTTNLFVSANVKQLRN